MTTRTASKLTRESSENALWVVNNGHQIQLQAWTKDTMSDVIVLAIPVALACAIVAVLVVALMKYNRYSNQNKNNRKLGLNKFGLKLGLIIETVLIFLLRTLKIDFNFFDVFILTIFARKMLIA